jgi:hypothetical protein
MTKKKTKKPTTHKGAYAVVGLEGYGLYYGRVVAHDPVARTATVADCRHVFRWYGGAGGISSLAAWGLCGPKKDQSRVGAPNPKTDLTRVAAVHYCSDEAIASFASFVPVHP